MMEKRRAKFRSESICFALSSIVLSACGANGTREPSDVNGRPYYATVLVVLGNEPLDDSTPTVDMVARVEKAAAFFRDHPRSLLVFTGGKTSGSISEAKMMADIAIRNGVPREAIRLEENARTTAENATLCTGPATFGRKNMPEFASEMMRVRLRFRKRAHRSWRESVTRDSPSLVSSHRDTPRPSRDPRRLQTGSSRLPQFDQRQMTTIFEVIDNNLQSHTIFPSGFKAGKGNDLLPTLFECIRSGKAMLDTAIRGNPSEFARYGRTHREFAAFLPRSCASVSFSSHHSAIPITYPPDGLPRTDTVIRSRSGRRSPETSSFPNYRCLPILPLGQQFSRKSWRPYDTNVEIYT